MVADLLKPTPDEIKLNNFMKKPLTKNEGLFVNVTRFFTDVNGTIILKNSAPVAAANMQNEFPFWMFGKFDMDGGYRISNIIAPPVNSFYVGTLIGGAGFPFLFATGLNTIQAQIKTGDIVHVFTNNLNAPTVYAWVIQSCGESSLASIYANVTKENQSKIDLEGAGYFAYSNNIPNFQWSRNINKARIDILGSYQYTPINPLAYRQVDDKQNLFIFMPVINFTVDQYHLLTSYIDFNLDAISFSFKLKKPTIKV